MNRNVKNREIEARLHRSLTNQVRVPQLGRGFDAGVWARIEAEEQTQQLGSQPVSRRSNAERWLMASNVIGLAVAALLVVIFSLRLFSAADLEASLPDASSAQGRQVAELVTWVVSGAVLGLGLMLTPLGRWLRSEFS
jgi:hypothetical protein